MVLKVLICGAGPAGLYAAYRIKRARPDAQIEVYEQNTADATFGFGVVFSDRALEFLRADDPETADAATRHMECWQDITIVHRGLRIAIDGIGFSAIGRLELLRLLLARLDSLGIRPHHATLCPPPSTFARYDLVVAADGVASGIRRAFSEHFGERIEHLTNRFAWFGTTAEFPTLTQTFVESRWGPFNAHHYRYAPGRSTFIVECGADTWQSAGFATREEADTLATCERIFADVLGRHRLISNRSIWRQFPWIKVDHWSHDNIVLIGDALHTAHFSIGSGTRLALEDAASLADALREHPADIAAALQLFEARRRPPVEKLVAASRRSAEWYESFADHMRMPPVEFARAYVNRSGRIDHERLAKMSPRFAALCASEHRDRA